MSQDNAYILNLSNILELDLVWAIPTCWVWTPSTLRFAFWASILSSRDFTFPVDFNRAMLAFLQGILRSMYVEHFEGVLHDIFEVDYPLGPSIPIPAESYPRYSNRFSPCIIVRWQVWKSQIYLWNLSNSCPPWWAGRWPPPWSWGSGGWGRQRSRTWWDSEPKYKRRFKTSYNHQHIRLHFGIWKQTIESKSVLYWGLGIHEPQTIARIGLCSCTAYT